jgi:hypothetical protein
MPPEAASFLRPRQIEAVADYLMVHMNGEGDPTCADCVAFFGEGSKACETYKKTAVVPTTEPNAPLREEKQ